MECEKNIPIDILVDLCSRFVINVPEEEQNDLIRICFQIELAHWFYIDFYSKNFPHKRPCGLKEFALQVFKHIPFLQPFAKNVDEVIEDWKDYKFCVPTFGAILLDENLTHCLLVQNYKSCWGFPKGKVNKDEPPDQCAIREVYEETGFDISQLINANEYIEATINNRVIRLYIVHGVNKSESFIPKTRNEIKAVDWFPVCDIPSKKKDAAFKQLKSVNGSSNNAIYSAFYMVSPFVKKLRQWIFEHNNNLPHRRRRPRHKSCSDIDNSNTLNLCDSLAMLRKLNEPEDKVNGKTDCWEEVSARTERRDAEESGEPLDSPNIPPPPQTSQQVLAFFRSKLFDTSENTLHAITAGSTGSKNTDRISRKSLFEQSHQGSSASLSQSQIPPSDIPSKGSVAINSSGSAFRRVEKTSRLGKRKRGKKGSDGGERAEGVQAIPAFLAFQFDIGAIIQSMNQAVLHQS